MQIDDLDTLTQEPGVYVMKDRLGNILYIGKAGNLKKRLRQYLLPGRDTRAMIPLLMAQVETIETIVTFSEKEALLLENNLIKRHQPKYNVLLKDDKTFISLLINIKHKWPMIRLVRCKKNVPLCFGPYTSAHAARQTLDLMHQVFKLRQCSDRELASRHRPCLLYEIKRCLAPCVGKCTKKIYDREVTRAITFLQGNNKELIQRLKTEREAASRDLDFEKAHVLHRSIEHIQHVIEHQQSVVQSKVAECDVFGMYQEGTSHMISKFICRQGRLVDAEPFSFDLLLDFGEGEWETFLLQHYQTCGVLPSEILLPLSLTRAPLLEEILMEKMHSKVKLLHPKIGEKARLLKLATKNAVNFFKQKHRKQILSEHILLDIEETCQLNRCPFKIECFDTSSFAQGDFVACMVGFTHGERDKKRTRLFNIKNRDSSDDCSALREMLKRHLEKSKRQDALPDLLLIDGGKGQLGVTLEVLKELKIACVDVIALAKEKGRHDKGLNAEKIFIPHKKDPIILSPRSSTLFMLQKMRDEAHRVAIHFHRKQRRKRMIASSLDQVIGIGPIKKTRLLNHFGSVEKIKEATDEALQEISGITRKNILALRAFFESSP